MERIGKKHRIELTEGGWPTFPAGSEVKASDAGSGKIKFIESQPASLPAHCGLSLAYG